MKLAETHYDNTETGCCARLDRELWDEKRHEWTDRPFLRDRIREFLHIPLNFGAVMARDHAAIEAAEAYPEDPLWLTDEVSPWQSDVYVATDRPVDEATMTTLSGTFLSKVFEGPYRHMGTWTREMEEWVRGQGEEAEHMYFYYPTCPKCAKAFGKNEVVLFAKVA
jgi:hypothetical protein